MNKVILLVVILAVFHIMYGASDLLCIESEIQIENPSISFPEQHGQEVETNDNRWINDVKVMFSNYREKHPSMCSNLDDPSELYVAAETWAMNGTSLDKVTISRSTNSGELNTWNIVAAIDQGMPLAQPKIVHATEDYLGIVLVSHASTNEKRIDYYRYDIEYQGAFGPYGISNEPGINTRPSIASDYQWNRENPCLFVVYINTSTSPNQLIFRKSYDGGIHWINQTILSDVSASDDGKLYTSISVFNSNVYVTFTDSNGSYDVVKVIKSSDAGSTWSQAETVSNNSTKNCRYPQIRAIDQTRVVVAYEMQYATNDHHIYCSYTLNNAANWTKHQEIAGGSINDRFPNVSSRQTQSGGSDIYIAYSDLSSNYIRIRKSTNLSVWSAPVTISSIALLSDDDVCSVMVNDSPSGVPQASVAWCRHANTSSNDIDVYFDSEWFGLTAPVAPTGFSAHCISSNQVMLLWNDNSTDELGFKIERRTGQNGAWEHVGLANPDQINYSDFGLMPNTQYTYRIRAFNAAYNSNYTVEASVTTSSGTVEAPIANQATNVTQTSFTANWLPVSGASHYKIDVTLSEDFSYMIPGFSNLTADGTECQITGLGISSTYRYRVRAVSNGNTSVNSNVIAVTTSGEGGSYVPNALPASNITSSSFRANWSSSPGATTYWIEIYEDNSFSPQYYSHATWHEETHFSHIYLSANKTYYYRVRAYSNNLGFSDYSNVVSVTTTSTGGIPEIPVATAASSITESGFRANWEHTSDGTEYWLFIGETPYFNEGFYTINHISTNYLDMYVLDPSRTYYYKLRAYNSNGNLSWFSNTISVRTSWDGGLPDIPLALPATDIDSYGFMAHWESSPGATHYTIWLCDNEDFNGGGSITGNGTSQGFTSYEPNTTRFYKVKAHNSYGSSDYSNIVSVTTSGIPPENAIASDIQSNSFTAQWDTVQNCSGYLIDVSTDFNFDSFLPGFHGLPVTSTSYSITSLNPGTVYYCQVKAIYSSCTSSPSLIIVETLPGVPEALEPWGITQTGFVAQCVPLQGADRYQFDIALDEYFSCPVGGYYGLETYSNSCVVSGLPTNQRYYYRVRGRNTSGYGAYSNVINVVLGIVTNDDMLNEPIITDLVGCYPNPFNPSTTIVYTIAVTEDTSLKIYNSKGQLVKTLINLKQNAGLYRIVWNGKDDSNRLVSSGIYYYSLKSGSYHQNRKMLIVK